MSTPYSDRRHNIRIFAEPPGPASDFPLSITLFDPGSLADGSVDAKDPGNSSEPTLRICKGVVRVSCDQASILPRLSFIPSFDGAAPAGRGVVCWLQWTLLLISEVIA